MNDLASAMAENDERIEQPKRRGRHDEEVTGSGAVEVIGKEVLHVCDGGPDGWVTTYFAIVDSAMSTPSIFSSAWIRGMPQSGFSLDIRRISARTSASIFGRPCLLDFQRQYSLNPFRCQATTVAGLTTTRADRQPGQSLDSHTQKIRSRLRSRGRLPCGRERRAGAVVRGFRQRVEPERQTES